MSLINFIIVLFFKLLCSFKQQENLSPKSSSLCILCSFGQRIIWYQITIKCSYFLISVIHMDAFMQCLIRFELFKPDCSSKTCWHIFGNKIFFSSNSISKQTATLVSDLWLRCNGIDTSNNGYFILFNL